MPLSIDKRQFYIFGFLFGCILYVAHSAPLAPDFGTYQKSLQLDRLDRWGLGFQLIGKTAQLFNSTIVLYLLSVVLIFIPILRISTDEKNVILWVFALIACEKGILFVDHIPRQILAVYLLFGVLYLVSNSLTDIKPRGILIAVVVASTMHFSAIIFGFFIVLFYVPLRWAFGIAFLGLALGAFAPTLLGFELFTEYLILSNTLEASGKNWLFFITFLTTINCVLLCDRRSFTMFIIACTCLLSFSYLSVFSVRLSYFIVPFAYFDFMCRAKKRFFGNQGLALCSLLIVTSFTLRWI